ncbi:MAG: DUF935 family protein [Candidatus Auribacterota bacterium]|jgi:phage gp29-like protein|nr:DUF935 family protein [Candidatus Auribacterota bacterium]
MATAKTADIDIRISSYDRTPKDIGKLIRALRAAEDPDYPDRSPLMNLYHDIMLDGHLTAVTEKRALNVLNTPVIFASKGKENEAVAELIGSQAFENLLRYIVESRFYGFSLIWNDITLPGVNMPRTKLIDRRHVVPERHIYKYKESDSLNAGIDYSDKKYAPYIVTAGRTDDLGLLLKCAPYVLYKRGDIADWATFCELFGMPLKKGKFPAHDPTARKELVTAMNEMGSAASVAIPDTCSIEFEQNKTTTSGQTVYEGLADFCNKEVSKIILCSTMTIDAEGGNYKGEVHAKSEDEVFEADRRFVLRILNTQYRNLLELHGYKPGDGLFSYVDEDSTPIDKRIEIDLKVNQAVEVPPEYFYERYNIPLPKGGAKARETNPGVTPQNTPQKLRGDEPDSFFKKLTDFFA